MEYRRLPPDLSHLLQSISLIDASDVQPQRPRFPVALVVRQRTRLMAKASELFYGQMIRADPRYWPSHTSDLERLDIPIFFPFLCKDSV